MSHQQLPSQQPQSLPRIDTPRLDVLEVEALPPPAVTRHQTHERQPGDALKHFREIAVRVMTQVALGQDPFAHAQTDRKTPVPENKENKEESAKKKTSATRMPVIGSPKKSGKQKVAWGNATTRSTSTSPTRQRKDPGRAPKKKSVVEPLPHASLGGGNKFASLVRLARFRKMSMSKRSDADDTIQEEEQEEEEEVLPAKPRFCATMSPEAQYAMLKGYEDMLLTTLQTKVRADRREALYRVRTPHKQVRSLHLAEQQDEQNTPQSLTPREIGQYQSQSTKMPTISNNYSTTGLTRTASISGHLNRDQKAIPKDKQLRLTSRFERAQDILDTVRLSQGSLVTSPRALHKVQGKKEKKPLDYYNAWSHAWAKEFKLQYGSPQLA